jgi:hypothetical protein
MAGASEFTEDDFIRYLRERNTVEQALRNVEVARYKVLSPDAKEEDIHAILDYVDFYRGSYGSIRYKDTAEWGIVNEKLQGYASMPIATAFLALAPAKQAELQVFAGENLRTKANKRKEQQGLREKFSVTPSSCGFAGCRGGRTKRSRKQRKTKRRARR